jgi:hypothetical protein
LAELSIATEPEHQDPTTDDEVVSLYHVLKVLWGLVSSLRTVMKLPEISQLIDHDGKGHLSLPGWKIALSWSYIFSLLGS